LAPATRTAPMTRTRRAIGFCGRSGSGKTTLLERLIPCLRAAGQRVAVIKHAHHRFDIDHVGKDSWRHREAGAHEVLIASSRRMARIREFDEAETPPDLPALLDEVGDDCDWVLVEGFKHAALPKIEVWRAAAGHPVQYPGDPWVVAVATDSPGELPEPTRLPVLDLNDAPALAAFLLRKEQDDDDDDPSGRAWRDGLILRLR
jgi:molybdopterin-guanine dinucleotide biosynthesis protein B